MQILRGRSYTINLDKKLIRTKLCETKQSTLIKLDIVPDSMQNRL